MPAAAALGAEPPRAFRVPVRPILGGVEPGERDERLGGVDDSLVPGCAPAPAIEGGADARAADSPRGFDGCLDGGVGPGILGLLDADEVGPYLVRVVRVRRPVRVGEDL